MLGDMPEFGRRKYDGQTEFLGEGRSCGEASRNGYCVARAVQDTQDLCQLFQDRHRAISNHGLSLAKKLLDDPHLQINAGLTDPGQPRRFQ